MEKKKSACKGEALDLVLCTSIIVPQRGTMVTLWVTIKREYIACKGEALDCFLCAACVLCAAKLVKTEGFKSILLAKPCKDYVRATKSKILKAYCSRLLLFHMLFKSCKDLNKPVSLAC